MDFTKLENFLDHLTSWRIPGNGVKVCLEGKEVFSYTSGYADVEKKNEDFIHYIVRLSNAERTSELLNATYERPDSKTHIIRSAMNRWREAGWKTAGANE